MALAPSLFGAAAGGGGGGGFAGMLGGMAGGMGGGGKKNEPDALERANLQPVYGGGGGGGAGAPAPVQQAPQAAPAPYQAPPLAPVQGATPTGQPDQDEWARQYGQASPGLF
jgi:hypothetical protein